MRGVVPDFDPPEVRPAATPDRVRHTLSFEVITPIFGGGVRPREADPISAVRVSGVVGHLRTWWRVCRGAAFSSVADLKRREDELWGSTDQRSRVSLLVRVTNPGVAKDSHKLPIKGNFAQAEEGVAPAYVSFPLQPKKVAGQWEGPWKLRVDVAFDLELSCPAVDWPDLEAALWAWEHFGGVGARTRRGFGALACVARDGVRAPLLPAATLVSELKKGIATHVKSGTKTTPKGLCWLHSHLVATKPERGGHEAWKKLIPLYRDFRQARRTGSDPKKPGRSFWPEPDMLRREDGRNSPGHAPSHPVPRYPRADFGLPIVFHFKDMGEPQDVILQGRNHDRRASPLILRPHVCQGGAVGLAALLVPFRPPPGGYALNRLPAAEVKVSLEGLPEEAVKAIKPLVAGDGKVQRDPMSALLQRIQQA